jgi:hypothetical protein
MLCFGYAYENEEIKHALFRTIQGNHSDPRERMQKGMTTIMQKKIIWICSVWKKSCPIKKERKKQHDWPRSGAGKDWFPQKSTGYESRAGKYMPRNTKSLGTTEKSSISLTTQQILVQRPMFCITIDWILGDREGSEEKMNWRGEVKGIEDHQEYPVVRENREQRLSLPAPNLSSEK